MSASSDAAPRSVLHLVGSAGVHSTAHLRLVQPLVEGLRTRGYGLQLWFLGEDGPLVEDCEAAGLNPRVIRWSEGRRDPRGAVRFGRALRTQRFAIVHQHFGGSSVRRVARAATSAKIVAHLHGRVSETAHGSVLVRRITDADAVLATSAAIARTVSGRPAHVVYPGVRVASEDRAPRARSRILVGTAARLVPVKGVIDLVRALAMARTDAAEVVLEIAGSGPERPHLEREIERLGLGGSVRFLGWKRDLSDVLGRWDVFAQASLEEGFGIAALEAMAAGLPVVATGVGGVPELVVDGKTGWLVPPGNPEVLAERIVRLVSDPELRASLGSAGRERARTAFSVERMVDAIESVYQGVLA